jgi:hypothetical protein
VKNEPETLMAAAVMVSREEVAWSFHGSEDTRDAGNQATTFYLNYQPWSPGSPSIPWGLGVGLHASTRSAASTRGVVIVANPTREDGAHEAATCCPDECWLLRMPYEDFDDMFSCAPSHGKDGSRTMPGMFQ